MTMAEYQIGHRARAVVGVAQIRPDQIPTPGLHTSEGGLMIASISAWKSHAWIARQLEFVPGAPLIQHSCANCARNLVEGIRTGDRYAVHVGVIRFNRLSEETTARWLAASCPGQRLESDKADLEMRFRSLACGLQ